MHHNLHLEGFGVRLRPVRLEDAAFIIWLRNLDHAKGRVGDSAMDLGPQQAWLHAYFDREGDYYFIVETPAGIPVGTYGLYGLSGASAESGRYIIHPEVPAAVPTAMVAFDHAFDRMGLTQLRGSAVSTNQRIMSLSRKFGFRQTHVQPAAQTIGGQPVDLVHFVLDVSDWRKNREKLLPLAHLAERQIREWEQAQQPTENLTR
jgi:RimJ/RimL family protein N-acetyltransferase